MADVTQNANNVKLLDNKGTPKRVKFGATIARGDWIGMNTSTGKYVKAGGSVAVEGMALTSGLNDEYGLMASTGSLVDVGATVLGIGVPYWLSVNAGRMCPYSDASAQVGVQLVLLGVSEDDTKFRIHIWNTGVVLP